MKKLPVVAIVGEPNVGKSTLLNKIAGHQFAVTSEVAGTTRDRQYIDTSWNGVSFSLVDTAGITFVKHNELESGLHEQIEIALLEADMLVFVVDGKASLESVDRKALLKFRKTKKPVVLVVNKLDSAPKQNEQAAIFASLGIQPLFSVSSVTGRGIGDLLDYIAEYIRANKFDIAEEKVPVGIAVSIVGKPNVGKSSIFNAISKERRVVVSATPGTTRTAIDTHLKYKDLDYTFIDTAGLKKKDHRQAVPDIYSGFQTFKAIRRSDICFFVIEATETITKQDQHIAQEIFTLHKGLIILANKYDTYEGDEQKLRDYISLHFPFLWMCPLFLVSAKTGQGLDEALSALEPIYESRLKTIPQERLDLVLTKTLKENAPKLLRDQKVPKVYGLKQIDTNPPLFELLVNYPAAISQQYRKYLEKNITKTQDFWGTPIKIILRGKDKK